MAKLQSLRGQVYDVILDRIKNGYYANGEKLLEESLMEEFEISRTPIREAFLLLAANGFVENRSRKGFFVKRVTTDEYRENYQIIGHLDALAAKLAVENLSESDFDALDALLKEIDTALDNNDFDLYDKLQSDFHNFYRDKCGNSQLINLLKSMNSKYLSIMELSTETINHNALCRKYNEQHKAISAAFRNRDVSALTETVIKHWTEQYFD